MVEVCAVFCYCLLWLDAYRQYMYVCGASLFYVCCSNNVGWGSVRMFVVSAFIICSGVCDCT